LKADILRWFNINLADFDEAELCAMRWMIDNKMTALDCSKKENYDIRGQLIDELGGYLHVERMSVITGNSSSK
jgi:hypothetical protein